VEDLIQLKSGGVISENIVNLYFKILEQVNQLLIQIQNLIKTETPTARLSTTMNDCGVENVYYAHSNWVRRMRTQMNQSYNLDSSRVVEDFDFSIKSLKNFDAILIPIFPEKLSRDDWTSKKPVALLALQPNKGWMADIFMRNIDDLD
jgi:hypothetical protein